MPVPICACLYITVYVLNYCMVLTGVFLFILNIKGLVHPFLRNRRIHFYINRRLNFIFFMCVSLTGKRVLHQTTSTTKKRVSQVSLGERCVEAEIRANRVETNRTCTVW